MVLDEGRVDSALKSKLDAYLAKGGKVLFTAKRVTLEPQGKEIPFRMKDGRLELELDRFTCHQMVVISQSGR
jgi:hypothetical protein